MSDTRSYRPGDWFGIFGDQATVVLPPSEKARVPGLWALVDAGAGFDEVLDALIADGLRDLPGFVLVSEADGETKVVLRGAATAVFTTAGETVTVEGSSVTTWAERSLTDVRTDAHRRGRRPRQPRPGDPRRPGADLPHGPAGVPRRGRRSPTTARRPTRASRSSAVTTWRPTST